MNGNQQNPSLRNSKNCYICGEILEMDIQYLIQVVLVVANVWKIHILIKNSHTKIVILNFALNVDKEIILKNMNIK